MLPMATEIQRTPEEARKEEWLKDLANFIVEANGQTWAADGAEVDPERPGYKELQYAKGDWRLRDSYTGYFRAPGMTTVYYKGKPAWTMQYGGHGQTEGYEDKAKETFNFLRRALMKVSPDLPFRGPEEYIEGEQRYGNDVHVKGAGHKQYVFEMVDGDIEEGLWFESIVEDGTQTFKQTGILGLVIHKDENGKPIQPWNI